MPGVADLVLRPGQPLAHRLERDQERERDLLGRQAAEGTQGQRHLRVQRQRRVAAGEDQLQPLVRDGGGVVHDRLRWLDLELTREQLRLRGQDTLSAKAVDGAVSRGRDQPADGVGRFPVAWPALGRDRERLLGGVLGQLDVAEDPDQRRQHATPVLAEDGVKRHGTALSRIGRTSIAPPGLVSCSSCGDGERAVEVVGLDQDHAGEVLLALDERPVGQQRPSVAVAQGRRRLVGVQAGPAGDVRPVEDRAASALVDRAVRRSGVLGGA